MRHRQVLAVTVLTSLLSAGARAQCGKPAGPFPRVSRAEQAARQRALSLVERMPQSRQAIERLGQPTRSDTFPITFSEALPDSTFVLYEFRFGADSYGIMQNRAGREWLDAVSLSAATPEWPPALQIGSARTASARDLGRPEVVATARDSTIHCYPVRSPRGGQLYLYYVNDTLRRVTWSLDLP